MGRRRTVKAWIRRAPVAYPRPGCRSSRDLAEVDAAIGLVAAGWPTRVRLVGLGDPTASPRTGWPARRRRTCAFDDRSRPERRPVDHRPRGAEPSRMINAAKTRPPAGATGDRRVRVRAARLAATSGHAGPGVVVARPAAIEPANARSPWGVARAAADRLRSAAGERRGSRRATVQDQGAGRLLQRQPVVGGLCDRGDPVHPARRGHGRVLAGHADLDPDRGGARRSSSSPIARPSAPTRTAAGATSWPREPRTAVRRWSPAAALLTDYVLTVSVSVAAGVAAITSAFPAAGRRARVELGAVAIVARHADQPARRPRERHGLRRPDVRLRRLDARAHRGRDRPDRCSAMPRRSAA